MELLKLPNVRIGKGVPIDMTEDRITHGDAKRLAWEIATKHPLWTVEVTGYRNFDVLSEGEVIGQVGAEWYGSQVKLYVRHKRLSEGNTRKNAYHTDSVDKAYLKAKKFFGRKTLAERLEEAHTNAEKVVEQQAWHLRHKMRDHQRPLERRLDEWAQANNDKFLAWLNETKQVDMLEHLTKLEELRADMVTIESVNKALNSNNTGLIVLSDGKYIVKIRDNVQLYDDVNLPVELRGKLGMLKLVGNEVMVTGIGCRVSDEIFVLMLESENEKTESQI